MKMGLRLTKKTFDEIKKKMKMYDFYGNTIKFIENDQIWILSDGGYIVFERM